MAERLQSGLLWYDGDPKTTLTQKVERAVARYQQKYGRRPDACYVHLAGLEKEIEWHGVRILGASNVLPNHFFVGCFEASMRASGRPSQ